MKEKGVCNTRMEFRVWNIERIFREQKKGRTNIL